MYILEFHFSLPFYISFKKIKANQAGSSHIYILISLFLLRLFNIYKKK